MGLQECGPVGPKWHDSPEKLHFDEQLREAILPGACVISRIAATVLRPYCSEPLFIQDRITSGNRIYPMVKIRTFDDPTDLSSVQKLVRELAADEFIQIGHVTPSIDSTMSMVSIRATTADDLANHKAVLKHHGYLGDAENIDVVTDKVRAGNWGIDSLAHHFTTPGSVEASLYKSRARWLYYNYASYELDMIIIYSLLSAAEQLLSKGFVDEENNPLRRSLILKDFRSVKMV